MKTQTELDHIFEAKDDPAFTRRFFREISLCIGIGFIMTIGLIWVLLNSEMIDKIKPEVQLIIFAVACGAFGIFRMILWIREKL